MKIGKCTSLIFTTILHKSTVEMRGMNVGMEVGIDVGMEVRMEVRMEVVEMFLGFCNMLN